MFVLKQLMRRIDRASLNFTFALLLVTFGSLPVLTLFEPQSWPIIIALCGWSAVSVVLLFLTIYWFLQPLSDLKLDLKLDAAEYEGQRAFFPLRSAPCASEQRLEQLRQFFEAEGFRIQSNQRVGETCCQLRVTRILTDGLPCPVGVLFDFIDAPSLSFPLVDEYLAQLSKKAKSLLAVKQRVICPCFLTNQPDLAFLKLFWTVDTYPQGQCLPVMYDSANSKVYFACCKTVQKKNTLAIQMVCRFLLEVPDGSLPAAEPGELYEPWREYASMSIWEILKKARTARQNAKCSELKFSKTDQLIIELDREQLGSMYDGQFVFEDVDVQEDIASLYVRVGERGFVQEIMHHRKNWNALTLLPTNKLRWIYPTSKRMTKAERQQAESIVEQYLRSAGYTLRWAPFELD